jgi:glycosyltransferase involved in cell wall biosynthesis
MPSTAIIVPCYNEEKRIRAAEFISFALQQPNIKFYFVNDGSTDDTQRVLFQIKEACQSEIIVLEKNYGKSEAIRKGFIHALENQHHIIGYLDADLSTDLEEFFRLENILSEKNLDMVLGSRIKKIDTVIERSFFRHILGRIIATIIDQRFKLGVYDTQCGAKIFRSSFIGNAVTKPFYTKWFFDVELLLRVKKLNSHFNAAEVPLSKWTNVRNSKLSILSFPAVFRDLFLLLNKY